jgi:hypothetical protein
MKTLDNITLGIFVGFWPVWLVWECVLLILRGAHPHELPGLISMVARDRGWSLTCVVYLWSGLAAHFWVNAGGRYAGAWDAVAAVSFWLIAVVLLAWDVALWRSDFVVWSPALRWARWPVAWMLFGTLSGRFLFPQIGRVPWK